MEEILTKTDLLNQLFTYSEYPDDDNIRFKEKIKSVLINSPELLYALNEKDLESELFDENENIKYDGEWDRYFSDTVSDGNIRPYLFIPESQTDSKNYVCYQTHFEEVPRYNTVEKYGLVTFTIFVHGENRIDSSTGIPRHDLIGSIIRDKINWSNIFGTQVHLVSNKESVTDNNYIVRTMVFKVTNVNSIVKTINSKNADNKDIKNTLLINKLGRM